MYCTARILCAHSPTHRKLLYHTVCFHLPHFKWKFQLNHLRYEFQYVGFHISRPHPAQFLHIFYQSSLDLIVFSLLLPRLSTSSPPSLPKNTTLWHESGSHAQKKRNSNWGKNRWHSLARKKKKRIRIFRPLGVSAQKVRYLSTWVPSADTKQHTVMVFCFFGNLTFE